MNVAGRLEVGRCQSHYRAGPSDRTTAPHECDAVDQFKGTRSAYAVVLERGSRTTQILPKARRRQLANGDVGPCSIRPGSLTSAVP